MKLRNGVEEGGLCAVEGLPGCWHVNHITLRGDVYLQRADPADGTVTNDVRMVKAEKVHLYVIDRSQQ